VNTIQTAVDEKVRACALSLYQRSAQLVAAKLAGLAAFYREQYDANSLRIVAEGGLAWSSVSPSVSYQQLLTDYLHQLLNAAGLSQLHVEIVRVDNANLIGAAVAAASGPHSANSTGSTPR
jgi:hexokinase